MSFSRRIDITSEFHVDDVIELLKKFKFHGVQAVDDGVVAYLELSKDIDYKMSYAYDRGGQADASEQVDVLVLSQSIDSSLVYNYNIVTPSKYRGKFLRLFALNSKASRSIADLVDMAMGFKPGENAMDFKFKR